MAEVPKQHGGEPDHPSDDPKKPDEGPGAGSVSILGIAVISVYLVAATIFCLYGLLVFWPAPTPAGGQQANVRSTRQTNSATNPVDSGKKTSRSTPLSPTSIPRAAATADESSTPALPEISGSASASPSPNLSPSGTPIATPGRAKAFGKEFEIWDEVRLLWIVILAGALGSLIHALRSVYWYVGNRRFVWSWIVKYLLQPFSGSALAVVFYFVIRGGFFSPQAGFANTSPFGFAAMAALVGLFSEQAVLKLQEVAETLFSRPQPGENSKPQKTVSK